MIVPDDAIIVVTYKQTRISRADRVNEQIIYVCSKGFPGVVSEESMAHINDKSSNPHSDSATGLVPPAGNAGKWFKLGANGLVVTDETPVYLKDVPVPTSEDGYIKTDAGGTALTLASVCMFPMTVDGHKLHFKGDATVAKRCYYGTDAVGNLGFYRKKAVS